MKALLESPAATVRERLQAPLEGMPAPMRSRSWEKPCDTVPSDAEADFAAPPSPSSSALVDLFAAPRHLLFAGDWFSLKDAARESGRGLVVNLQPQDVFASHQLNRDTWKDPRVCALVERHCLLWQCDMNSRAAATIRGFYNMDYLARQTPQTLLLHPRTGELVHRAAGFVEPAAMVALLAVFLADHCGVDAAVAARLGGGAASADEDDAGAERALELESSDDGGIAFSDDEASWGDDFSDGGDEAGSESEAAEEREDDEAPRSVAAEAEALGRAPWVAPCAAAVEVARRAATAAVQCSAVATATATAARFRRPSAPPPQFEGSYGPRDEEDAMFAQAVARSVAAAADLDAAVSTSLKQEKRTVAAFAVGGGAESEDAALARAIALSLAATDDGIGSNHSGTEKIAAAETPAATFRVGDLAEYSSAEGGASPATTVVVVLAVHDAASADRYYTIATPPTWREKQTIPAKLNSVSEGRRAPPHRYREVACAAAVLLMRARRGDGASARGECAPVVLKVRLPSGRRTTLSGLCATDAVAEIFVRVAELLAAAEEAGKNALSASRRVVRLESLDIVTQYPASALSERLGETLAEAGLLRSQVIVRVGE
jgi:hypothetical protein